MAAGGSNMFTATVGNLRHYLRDRQGQQQPPPPQQQQHLRGLAAGGPVLQLALPVPAAMEGPSAAAEDRTMQLFPTRPASMPQQNQTGAKKETVRLAISCERELHLFANFPADKARYLMQLATSFMTQAPPSGSPVGCLHIKRVTDLPLEDLFDSSEVRRRATTKRVLYHWQPVLRALTKEDLPVPEATVEKQASVDLAAMKDKPEASWLGL